MGEQNRLQEERGGSVLHVQLQAGRNWYKGRRESKGQAQAQADWKSERGTHTQTHRRMERRTGRSAPCCTRKAEAIGGRKNTRGGVLYRRQGWRRCCSGGAAGVPPLTAAGQLSSCTVPAGRHPSAARQPWLAGQAKGGPAAADGRRIITAAAMLLPVAAASQLVLVDHHVGFGAVRLEGGVEDEVADVAGEEASEAAMSTGEDQKKARVGRALAQAGMAGRRRRQRQGGELLPAQPTFRRQPPPACTTAAATCPARSHPNPSPLHLVRVAAVLVARLHQLAPHCRRGARAGYSAAGVAAVRALRAGVVRPAHSTLLGRACWRGGRAAPHTAAATPHPPTWVESLVVAAQQRTVPRPQAVFLQKVGVVGSGQRGRQGWEAAGSGAGASAGAGDAG